jgi:hypothetical protein
MTGGAAKEEIVKIAPVKKIEPEKIAAKPVTIPPKADLVGEDKKPKKPFDKIQGRPAKKIKRKAEKLIPPEKKEEKPVSFIPVFEAPALATPILQQRKMEIIETESKPYPSSSNKTIRRSGLEIKKAEELQEKKRIAQEKEWEIPAFLRKVKFKN